MDKGFDELDGQIIDYARGRIEQHVLLENLYAIKEGLHQATGFILLHRVFSDCDKDDGKARDAIKALIKAEQSLNECITFPRAGRKPDKDPVEIREGGYSISGSRRLLQEITSDQEETIEIDTEAPLDAPLSDADFDDYEQ